MDWLYLKRKEFIPSLGLDQERRERRILKEWYATVATLVYHLWKARNTAVWEHKVLLSSRTITAIIFDVKSRIKNIIGKKVTSANRNWFSKL